jgi:SAM-dependent methyltransferase
MEATLRPIDAPLIRALELEAPSRVADVGCGGGGTAIELLRHAPPGTFVHGFDISPSLIELARGRVAPDERAIAFDVADVATTEPVEPFARLVSRFGVMFFHDPRRAFENLSRWLAPAGRFAFAVWGPPAENPWLTSVREEVARVVEVPRLDHDAPGPFRYADADRLVALLEHAGLRELEVRPWRGALPVGGRLQPAEAAQFALSSFSSFGVLLARAGDDAFAEVRSRLTSRFARHHRDGAIRMHACVHILTGSRR